MISFKKQKTKRGKLRQEKNWETRANILCKTLTLSIS